MLFIARLLDKANYGEFVAIQSTVAMVGTIATFGIGTTATRYVASLRLNERPRLARILALTERTTLLLACLATVILLLSAPTIAATALATPDLTSPLCIVALSLTFSSMDAYQKSVLVGLEAMRAVATASILGAGIGATAAILLAQSYGLNGAALGLTASAALQAILSRFQMRRELNRIALTLQFHRCWSEWRVLRDFALPSLVASISIAPAHWICQMMLLRSANGYAELAVFGVAMQWFNALLFIPNAGGRAILPVLTERLTAGAGGEVVRTLKVAVAANVLLVTPVAIALSVGSPWLIATYGPSFHGEWRPLALAALVAIMVVAAAPVGHILSAGNRMWIAAAMNAAWAAVYVAGAGLFLKLGAFGVVSALGVAYLAHTLWVSWYAVGELTRRQLRQSAVRA